MIKCVELELTFFYVRVRLFFSIAPIHFKLSIDSYTRCTTIVTLVIHNKLLKIIRTVHVPLESRTFRTCSLDFLYCKYNRRHIECQQQSIGFVTKCDRDHTYVCNVLIIKEIFAWVCTLL